MTATSPRAPSGEQFELACGDWRLTVVEVGGGMRLLSRRDWAILDGYPRARMCNGGRGQILIPWPNRIDRGRYTFDGEPLQLPLTEPRAGNAIHGLVRWSHWRAVEREPARAVMEHTLDPQPGYPFTLVLRVEYLLSDAGLRVATTVTNGGARRCPFGVGFHPYFSCANARIDLSRLRVAAREFIATDGREIPTERRRVEGSAFDFRRMHQIGTLRLDRAFGMLDRDAHGRAWVELASADERRRIAVWLDSCFEYVHIFTGDTLPVAEQRRGVAIEPMTCPANAFATGDGLRVLDPGASWRCEWGVTVRSDD